MNRKWTIFAGIVITALLLASCVRPTNRVENPNITDGDPTLPTVAPTTAPAEGGDAGDTSEPAQPTQIPVEEPDTGEGEGDSAGDGDGTGDAGNGEGDSAGDGDGTGDAGDGEGDSAGDGDGTGDAGEGEGDSAGDGDAGEGEAGNTTPSEHTVQAGENLYRIGLQYGLSFLQIAEANNIAAPYTISVGQKLTIPGGDDDADTGNDAETTYVVKAGDTLFSIGVAQGVSWVQIAEANGLSDPNRISPGDTLKIPVSTPGPTPQFSHTVRTNETLYSIAVQYGVSWTAIASENNISSPYIIFPGSVLKIPSN